MAIATFARAYFACTSIGARGNMRAPGSFLMIHCPYATMAGTADELTNAAAVLRAIEPLLRNVFSSFWAACGRSPYDDATGDLALGSRCCPA